MSFEGNLIADIEEFSSLKVRNFHEISIKYHKNIKLRELVLNGNPIKSVMTSENLVNELSKKFQTLQYLDGQRIENPNVYTYVLFLDLTLN